VPHVKTQQHVIYAKMDFTKTKKAHASNVQIIVAQENQILANVKHVMNILIWMLIMNVKIVLLLANPVKKVLQIAPNALMVFS
jgi:hypothetical protein